MVRRVHYFHYETNFCPDVNEDLFVAEPSCRQNRSQGKNAPSMASYGRVFRMTGCLMGVSGQIWAQERAQVSDGGGPGAIVGT